MKEFNAEKFCKDLVSLREKESQDNFAKKLEIKRPTLSLLENGKQIPTIDLLSKICSKYIENYGFIKKVLQEIKIFEQQVSSLYSTANNYIVPYSTTYQDMENAFITGNASREDILKDARTLFLDMNVINELVEQEEVFDDDEDDEELFSIINAKRG